jgi:hypothetical protein
LVQILQKNDIYSNLLDIRYNFIIGGDGSVYEGRGWENQGAHTKKENVDSIGVAYIGTFKSKVPNKTLLDTGFRLFEEGVRIKAIKKDYKIYGASQFYAESLQNPGREFMNLIETWPQWAGPTYGIIGG